MPDAGYTAGLSGAGSPDLLLGGQAIMGFEMNGLLDDPRERLGALGGYL